MEEIKNNDITCLNDKNCLILLYFTASWCGPCKRIKPMLDKLAEGLGKSKIEFFMIDIDDNDELVEEYNIKSVPTFYLFHKGTELGSTNGADITKVHQLIKDNLNKVKN